MSAITIMELQPPLGKPGLYLDTTVPSAYFDPRTPELEAESLAAAYVAQQFFAEHHLADALHVALASVHRLANLVSWNFRHLVKVRTRRGVNLVNALHGYEPIEIVAPPEL